MSLDYMFYSGIISILNSLLLSPSIAKKGKKTNTEEVLKALNLMTNEKCLIENPIVKHNISLIVNQAINFQFAIGLMKSPADRKDLNEILIHCLKSEKSSCIDHFIDLYINVLCDKTNIDKKIVVKNKDLLIITIDAAKIIIREYYKLKN